MNQNLLALRQKAQITQKEAACYLGISLRSYQSYEKEPDKQTSYKYEYLVKKLLELSFVDETHGILTVEEIKKICGQVFSKYPVQYCYLFGSYAKGHPREDSDVDLLISSDISGLKFYALIEDLTTTLRKKVDILDKNQLLNNTSLINEILKDGIKIYG